MENVTSTSTDSQLASASTGAAEARFELADDFGDRPLHRAWWPRSRGAGRPDVRHVRTGDFGMPGRTDR